MNLFPFASLFAAALICGAAPAPALAQETTPTAAAATRQPPGMVPCEELPTGELSDEELAELVAEGSPGKVRIGWRTESQEECYGFHIYRSETPGGPWMKVNRSIIPGEGSTNIPTNYCYEDNSVERGKIYFYHIEEISNQGVATKLEDTLGPEGKGTQVKVKTVAEERAWLRKKALGDSAAPAPADSGTTEPAQPETK